MNNKDIINLIENKINIPEEKFFCSIIGSNPSKGARSPLLWNTTFEKMDIDIKMIPFDCTENHIKKLLQVLEKNDFYIGGAIAAPFKEHVFNWLGENITEKSRKIGAVNCIFKENNKLIGTNTDGEAAVISIKKSFGQLNNKNVVILGSGGTAKAIAAYLIPELIPNGKLTIVGRDLEKLQFHKSYKNIPMLSRTHGQPASPTFLGKEFAVFYERLYSQLIILNNTLITTKFGGAVGNMNAHYLAYPSNNWENLANTFLNNMGLKRNEYTTQIDNYENLSIIFDNIKRINTILVDMCRDIWTYISMDYLKQQINKDEVGSSTMPQKVNPINFENAEGNLMMSITMLEFLSRKLPISRLQRDLTDSTVLRNLGITFGWIEIAFHNINMGLHKISINNEKINEDNNNNLSVLTEGFQTLLRKWGDDNAYNKLKDLSRTNNKLREDDINNFIDELNLDNDRKEELKNIKINNYIGNSNKYK